MPKDRSRMIREIGRIIYRNVFLLINAVLFAVAILLLIFGEVRAAVFLTAILFINITLGVGQEVNAWLSLEKLQLLTALKMTRLTEDGQESVEIDQIKIGDRLKLKLGDQVPCDGRLIEGQNLEINQGLITGESDSEARSKDDVLAAGSIVTAGSGVMMVDRLFRESRVSRMTEGVKARSLNESPIQRDVGKLILYCGYFLIAAIVFSAIRGYLSGEPAVLVIKNIGALAGSAVPQGLVFALTLLFAYGAVNLYRQDVLLQEVNAAEKLGHIRNLCMDKTGTITETKLSVKEMVVGSDYDEEKAKSLMAAYALGSGDSSETIKAIIEFVGRRENKMKIIDRLPFSSWRQFGAVKIDSADQSGNGLTLFTATPETILPRLSSEAEREKLGALLEKSGLLGQRVFCLAAADSAAAMDAIGETKLTLVAGFVLYADLRPGMKEAVSFFQDRGIRIRILSGDNEKTVRAVSAAAGIVGLECSVGGDEMSSWSAADFREKAGQYGIFARIKPEQKEKIVEALRKDGFTAMIGDGANDALAIKKADLGIAMFEGAAATRSLASIVLLKNSFAALPGGVRLADDIVSIIDIVASLFFSQTILTLLFFLLVSLVWKPFPLTPFNVTLINYFTVGIPSLLISWWAIHPSGGDRGRDQRPFLRRILPFSVVSAVLAAIVSFAVFLATPDALRNGQANIPVVLSFIFFGLATFAAAPLFYRYPLNSGRKAFLLLFLILELILLYMVFKIPFLVGFFDIGGH